MTALHPAPWSRIAGATILTALLFLTHGCRQLSPRSPEPTPISAEAVLEACGMTGGLVVVVGCDDPALLAGLGEAGPYLVHGLDVAPSKIDAARRHLQDRNLYGPVTVSRWSGAQLPYVDSLVNLILMTGDAQVPAGEITRVLAPRGVIADIRQSGIVIARKDRPEELDDWTHYLYDASNNAVSHDTVVGPIRGLRWTSGPKYARSHEHFASLSAMVSAAGRVFTIIDEGPISSVHLPAQWQLVARDAFSGVLLWKRSVANWESHLRGFRSGPPEIGRRIVAKGDRIYAALGYGEPVAILDAATGHSLMTIAGTEGARELLLAHETLYVLADDLSAGQHRDRREWIDQMSPTLDIWWEFPKKAIPMYGTQRIAAVRAGSDRLVWERGFEAPGQVMPTTMAVSEGRLCVQTVSHVVCLDAADGGEVWRSPRPVASSRFSWSTPTLVIQDGVVLTVDRTVDNAGPSPPAQGSEWIVSSDGTPKKHDGEMVAFSLADGKELWRNPHFENYNVPPDVFVINGVAWVGNLRAGRNPGFTQGRDLKTGKVTVTLPPQSGGNHPQSHHNCYRNKATVRWFLLGRQRLEFVDPRTGTEEKYLTAKGGCQYGIMPANGLVYTPQHSCACTAEGLLVGFNALSPRSSVGAGGDPLEEGPAYGTVPDPETGTAQSEWPTYRQDVGRSGYQNLPAPGKPHIAWTKRLSPPVTAPVSARGIVAVAEIGRHSVHAFSAGTGEPVWTFVADGRTDSPPTLFKGLCLFGTRSGFVYCLRAADGTQVWRFRAATRDRRLFAYGQLESVWPVHGSVLVDDQLSGGVPVAYVAAGRSSGLDGGIRLYALAADTGKVRHTADVATVAGAQGSGIIRQQVLPDILSIQRGAVWMRHLGVDERLAPVERRDHLYAPRGFLDDAWWHRTYWIHGTVMMDAYGGWPVVGNRRPAGRLLARDGGGSIYGYGRMAYRAGDGHTRADATASYKLFSEDISRPPDTKWKDMKRAINWARQLPFIARSIVLSRDGLIVAGGESLTDSVESHGPGTLWVASREDGSKRAECRLPAPPVLDGMILSDAGIFLSAIDGSLIRLVDAEQ